MQGILSAAGYVPRRRLDLSTIRDVMGSGGGSGTRAVAGPDEDTTTMGVEAGRLVQSDVDPAQLWFATARPAYLDKTNATAVHAALRLDPSVPAVDFGGATRSGVGALVAALRSSAPTLVVSADLCSGPPTSPQESSSGDGAAALLVGSDDDGPLAAELLGIASVTDELLDRWRAPGDAHTRHWEERFAESVYPDLAGQAWKAALADAGVETADLAHVAVTGTHARAVSRLPRTLRVDEDRVVSLAGVGAAGTADAGLLLTEALSRADAGDLVALVSVVDGADVLVLRATGQGSVTPAVAEGALDVDYATFLTWRGELRPSPPNRPPPDRVSAPAAHRNREHKFGFAPMADSEATVVTFTVDKLVYSLSPPVVFAVVQFDDGADFDDGSTGRVPLELTDVDADAVAIGDRVETTFRRVSTADGIHNYFWKGRPVR